VWVVAEVKRVNRSQPWTQKSAQKPAQTGIDQAVRRMRVQHIDLPAANDLQQLPEREVVDLLAVGFEQLDDFDASACELVADVAAVLQAAHRDVEPPSIDSLGQVADDRFSAADPQRRGDDEEIDTRGGVVSRQHGLRECHQSLVGAAGAGDEARPG
jgi:hypothetical protein